MSRLKFELDDTDFKTTSSPPCETSSQDLACGNSPQSSQTVADLDSNLKYSAFSTADDNAMEAKPSFIAKINCEDLVLEQIVDDVDNMYR